LQALSNVTFDSANQTRSRHHSATQTSPAAMPPKKDVGPEGGPRKVILHHSIHILYQQVAAH
jgi:hypothetical protein